MNNKLLFRIAFGIMIITLLIMGINRMIFTVNDWVIRITGIIMMIDLVVLVYSRMRIRRQDT